MTGPDPRREVKLPAGVLAWSRNQPLLRGLIATGAGYALKAAGRLFREAARPDRATLLYCAKGGGWHEQNRRLQAIRPGELVAISPGVSWRCGLHPSNPGTLHWVHAAGENLPAYLEALAGKDHRQTVWVGDDPQVVRFFNEIFQTLERGTSFAQILQASHALGYLLARVIAVHGRRQPAPADTVQKVAQAIVYMSEHLGEPLRVTALARLAGLSPAHFSVRFREQTGCSPRDYLHLLRMHRACQLLLTGNLNVKEVATRLGYTDPFHFSRQFKAFEGLSPSDYRASKISSS